MKKQQRQVEALSPRPTLRDASGSADAMHWAAEMIAKGKEVLIRVQ